MVEKAPLGFVTIVTLRSYSVNWLNWKSVEYKCIHFFC